MAIPRNTSSAMAIFILLLVFISELLWSTSEALTQDCHVPEVTDGQTGMMVFFIDRRVNFSSDHFFANLIRSDEPDWDILNCDQPNGTSHVGCKINSPKYKSRGVRDHKLTVFIPNITQHYADTYVFQVYINSIAQPPVFCSVLVKKRLQPDINRVIKTETATSPWVITGVVFLFMCSLTLAIVVVVLTRTRTRASGSNNDETSGLLKDQGDSDEQGQSLQNKRWFLQNVTDQDEERFLAFRRNGPGSFLVTKEDHNPEHYALVVIHDGDMKRLVVLPEEGGFKCSTTGISKTTVCGIVNHYKENDITVNGVTWGRLSKPIQEEPDEPSYVGALTKEDEKKMLLWQGNRTGSFLFRDNSKWPDAYCLSVNYKGNIVRLRIDPVDEGYKMIDTGLERKTLSEFVNHYKEHEIKVDGHLICDKLGQPCAKDPPDEWYSKILTVEDETSYSRYTRTRQGSFLITDGNAGTNSYSLAVYLDTHIKRFRVQQQNNGFRFLTTGMFFHSWYELVDYYRKHTIQVADQDLGKLAWPLRKEPEEDWYFGSITKEDEKRMLSCAQNRIGAYLIRDSTTVPINYVLAVKLEDDIAHFGIIPDDTSFTMLNIRRSFKTLSELVHYYTQNEIEIDNQVYDKLSHPCIRVKNDPDDRELTTKEKQILEKNGPGSFFFKDSSIPGRRVLAVNANGEMKQLMIIKSNDSCKLADIDILHRDEAALERYYRRFEITRHGDTYGYLQKNCTHDLEKK